MALHIAGASDLDSLRYNFFSRHFLSLILNNEFKKLLVENPESVSTFMENIIETGQEDAMIVFSTLAKPFPDLVSRLKPHMSYSTYLTLLNKVDEDIEEKIDPDTKDKFLLTFSNTVRAIANEKNSVEKTPDHKVSGFLE